MSRYVSAGPKHPPRLTRAERLHNVRALTRQGLSAAEIAVRLQIADRTVFRYRAEACRAA